ncbi:SETMR methyltransferase, partial [Acromyrmex charruanus]
MDSKLEQRTCIKFCCKNEIKCSDTLKILQKCYGDDTLSKTQVYQWYECFKSGREAVEDDARPGRPSTSKTDENVDEIRQLLIENRKLTIREIAETTNISFGSVQSILREDLGLILHDDNAPSYNALIIREFLDEKYTLVRFPKEDQYRNAVFLGKSRCWADAILNENASRSLDNLRLCEMSVHRNNVMQDPNKNSLKSASSFNIFPRYSLSHQKFIKHQLKIVI